MGARVLFVLSKRLLAFVGLAVAILTITAPISAADGMTIGDTGSWQSTTALPSNIDIQTAAVYNGHIYSLGGQKDTAYNFISTVYYAKVASDGSVGSWQTTTSLPDAVGQANTVASNGYLYEIGGYTATASDSVPDVYYAKINTDGSLGSWHTTTSLPTKNEESLAFSYEGYLYEMTGSQGGYDARDVIYYAKINTDGSLGSWQTSTSTVPTAVTAPTGGVWNGRVYIVGGYDGTNPSKIVQYARLNGDGSLGSWQAATSLPVGTVAATGVISNGYIYNIGGTDDTWNDTTSITSAKINADGSLGSWQIASNALPTAIDSAAAVSVNGYLYQIAGEDGAGVFTNDVRFSKLNFVNQQSGLQDVSGKPISISTPAGTHITCSSISQESVTHPDPGFIYPLGLVDFCFTTDLTDNTASLTFVTDLKPSQVVARYFDTVAGTYSDVGGATITETTVGGQHALQLRYTLTDNGSLDSNTATGTIDDPIGLAIATPSAATTPNAPNTGVPHRNNIFVADLGFSVMTIVVIAVVLLRRNFRKNITR